jgi:NAD(P)-dependent dehydrogenase (short-subunit alcohol dehydrogenase family)
MSTAQHNLQDQRVLVTGATSGIGRAIALQLARDGAAVIVHGRDATRGADTVTEISAAGGQARFVAADLSNPADLQRLVADVGAVDVLVNNAGFSWFGPTADLDVATFDALFASNVRAAFFLVAAFAPGMAARGTGSIINVSSMAGPIGLAGGAAYGATKAALSSLTRAWARGIQPQRCARERHRPRPGVHRRCRTRTHRSARDHHLAQPRRERRGDRRSGRLHRLAARELRHRCNHRR